jgi:hypothetical protein
MKNDLRIILITLTAYCIYYALDFNYFNVVRAWLTDLTQNFELAHYITYTLSGVPLFLAILIMHGNRDFFNGLGLNNSITKGLFFPLVWTLPMFIGFSIMFDFNSNISWTVILLNVVAAGFFEELYFRGFLFGQPFRYTHIGFLLSVITGAVLFGLVHLYQGNDISELIGIFLITFSGGLFFAWIFAEWDYNIWMPVFLHLFMNLAWELFSVSSNALGDLYANIFRTATIICAIVFTVLYKKRKKIPFEINRRTLFPLKSS